MRNVNDGQLSKVIVSVTRCYTHDVRHAHDASRATGHGVCRASHAAA